LPLIRTQYDKKNNTTQKFGPPVKEAEHSERIVKIYFLKHERHKSDTFDRVLFEQKNSGTYLKSFQFIAKSGCRQTYRDSLSDKYDQERIREEECDTRARRKQQTLPIIFNATRAYFETTQKMTVCSLRRSLQ
jgi:hypothetical protein